MLLAVSFTSIEAFIAEVLQEKFHVSRHTVRGEHRVHKWTGRTPVVHGSTIKMSAVVGDQLFRAEESFESELPEQDAIAAFLDRFDGFRKKLELEGLQFRAGNFAPFVKGVAV